MSDQSKRLFLGLFLIAAGTVFLFQQLFHLPFGSLFFGALFALGGLFSFPFYIRSRKMVGQLSRGLPLLGWDCRLHFLHCSQSCRAGLAG